MLRNYIATYRYTHHGTYTQEIEYMSEHRANSKANKADALHEIWKRKERGIAQNAEVLDTRLNDE